MNKEDIKTFISACIDNNPRITNKDIVKSKLGIYVPQVDKPHWFITIALPNERNPKDMVDITKNLERHAYMSNYCFSIEFFSKSGENQHIHILVWGSKVNKTKTIRDFSRKYDVSANFIDIKHSKKAQDFLNRYNYIKGNKDDTKMESVEKDRARRRELDLLDYYE
jgi:hypothetical protein